MTLIRAYLSGLHEEFRMDKVWKVYQNAVVDAESTLGAPEHLFTYNVVVRVLEAFDLRVEPGDDIPPDWTVEELLPPVEFLYLVAREGGSINRYLSHCFPLVVCSRLP